MEMNILAIVVAALVPLVVGFIWFNPKVFGNAWMKASGMTQEKAEGANMPLIMGLSLLFSAMLAMFLNSIFIHQNGLLSLFATHPDFEKVGSEVYNYIQNFKDSYGHLHRSFGHGMAHGGFFGIFVALPLIGTHALYERKSWKYILINVGYWWVCAMIMGGILSAWR